MEAFSDGVIAILITIMVLELRPPWNEATEAYNFHELQHAFPAYVLSFVGLAIYWNNHHHMMHACTRVNGRILWTNMHLLFWLSLFPLVTAWISTRLDSWSAAAYGGVGFMSGIGWMLLKGAIIAEQGPDSRLKAAIGDDWKGRISGLAYLISVPLAFVHPYITISIQVAVALMWIIPDRRIESQI
jgi:uncharacterized membrane protein